MKITARRWEYQYPIAINKFREDANTVFKPTLLAYVPGCQVIVGVNLAAVAHPKSHAEVSKFCIFAAGHKSSQCTNGMNRLASPGDFGLGQISDFSGIITLQMHQVQIGHFSRVMYGTPGTTHCFDVIGHQTGLDCLIKRFFQEW